MLHKSLGAVILFGSLLCADALSESPHGSWICREAGTLWAGNSIFSCGVGEGGAEADARREALANAYEEIETVCIKSGRCQLENLEIIPARMECRFLAGRFVCYRGLRAVVRSDGASRRQRSSVREIQGVKAQVKTFDQLHSITESIARSMEALF